MFYVFSRIHISYLYIFLRYILTGLFYWRQVLYFSIANVYDHDQQVFWFGGWWHSKLMPNSCLSTFPWLDCYWLNLVFGSWYNSAFEILFSQCILCIFLWHFIWKALVLNSCCFVSFLAPLPECNQCWPEDDCFKISQFYIHYYLRWFQYFL